MIVFKTVSVKNFLSYGNYDTKWFLDKHNSTLIVGRNGHGKSVLLDAVCFGLFGKPYRNINKPQLVNSINQKACVVELDLVVNGVEYKIIRGMKPNVFDVYCQGKMLDQEAAMRDMQTYLEQQILKLNFKTFCQVVILGSASYTPFMQLPAHQRREVVEDVLDIGIFSKMNGLLKDRIAGTKEELRIIEIKVDSAKKEAQAQKRIIELIEKNKTSRISEINDELTTLQEELGVVMSSLSAQQVPDYVSANALRERYTAIVDRIDDLKATATQLKTRLARLESLEECPTCIQGISHDHKTTIKNKFEEECDQIDQNLNEQYPSLKEVGGLLQAAEKEQGNYETTKETLTQSKSDLTKSIKSKQDQIEKIKEDSGDVDAEKEKMKAIAAEALQFISRKNELSEEKQLQEVSQVLLKDNGIKTAIIREYLPVLNKLINKYLTVFDFFVNFNLDESFNEVIKSRGRDEFSYASFSEGEKKRIDLAILLSFRQVAAMKNSAKVNLLIFDEVQDSSLDLDARAKFNDLLDSMAGSNVFVISHTDTSPDAYDAVIKVEKRGDFSQYEYV
jgi:DNA repair exonuclease SbcCD ATPase subunit